MANQELVKAACKAAGAPPCVPIWPRKRTAVIIAITLFMGSETMQPLQDPSSPTWSPVGILHGVAGLMLQYLHYRAEHSNIFAAMDPFLLAQLS